MAQNTLSGQTALITGAAKRIGREIAFTLAEAGCRIIIHYNRSPGEAEALRAELRLRGAVAWTVQADFEQPEQYETLFERARQLSGPVEILINNASIFPVESLWEVTRESFLRCLEVNAWVPLALCRHFARQTGRGKIINLLDAALVGYDEKHVAYQLSKHVLALLTRISAIEFAPHITVNAVAPGYILAIPGQEQYLERRAAAIPLQRRGAAEEIAASVLDLIRSDYITGEVLFVDGGMHLQEKAVGAHPY